MYDREQEMNFLFSVFTKFDKDKDKYLDINEYKEFIYKIAENTKDMNCVNDVVITSVFDYYDTNSDNLLSFKDILDWWIGDFTRFYIHENCEFLVKAHDIFNKYSENKVLTYSQFEKLSIDNNILNSGSIFDAMDSDGNGIMNFKEFVSLLGWIE